MALFLIIIHLLFFTLSSLHFPNHSTFKTSLHKLTQPSKPHSNCCVRGCFRFVFEMKTVRDSNRSSEFVSPMLFVYLSQLRLGFFPNSKFQFSFNRRRASLFESSSRSRTSRFVSSQSSKNEQP